MVLVLRHLTGTLHFLNTATLFSISKEIIINIEGGLEHQFGTSRNGIKTICKAYLSTENDDCTFVIIS